MEFLRWMGDSGIVQVRNVQAGTQPWTTNTWSRVNGQAAIHNHANNIRTIGMGELGVVMNGVPFRTRHNDYRLSQAHSNSTEFGATEPVEFPAVPPSVLAQPTIDGQIAEMREYFVAWKTQNPNHRDYKEYFQPVLTYMQGMWTIDEGTVDEPFFSDRHSIQAETWFKLQEDVMHSVWTGKKDIGENLAILPTMYYDVGDDGTPLLAQWNYNILTHKISSNNSVELSRFRLVKDLSPMMRSSKSEEDFIKTRSARFQLHPALPSESYDGVWREEGNTGYANYLESLMKEVPGLDNYQADILDSNFGSEPLKDVDGTTNLNAGYYHRYYSQSRDASGFTKTARGFADSNLFVAYNTQPNVAPIKVRKSRRGNSDLYEEVRVSYALPLEIVYMTPLLRWNPYNIEYHEDTDVPTIGNGTRRNGQNSTAKAYNGTSSKYYYRCPAKFFESVDENGDPADTAKDYVFVLDKDGEVRRTVASGTRIFLPNIPGLGNLRTRFPIFNVYQEGSGTYKELSALKDITLDAPQHIHLYDNVLGGFSASQFNGAEKFTFALRHSTRKPHTHEFLLSANQLRAMRAGAGHPGYVVQVQTTTMANHNHDLVVGLTTVLSSLLSGFYTGGKYIRIFECDRQNACQDGHAKDVDCLDCALGMLDP
ncbi:uncharacterized protein [Watersipora subatra]|uniref:uncharacterized protein n=1 Tax=Watersipora subatra TaxID=2589382 RepID=UPI00355B9D4F